MRGERVKLPRWLVWSGVVLVVWAVFAALLVLQLLPDTPKTPLGWGLLIVIGPPAYVVLEWASSRLFSDAAGARISTARFSVARIALALLIAVAALAAFAWWALRNAS